MTGKTDPRAIAALLRTIAASPVPVKSFAVDRSGAVTFEFFDGPGKTTAYVSPEQASQTIRGLPGAGLGPEAEREAWDMVGDSVIPGMLGEAN